MKTSRSLYNISAYSALSKELQVECQRARMNLFSDSECGLNYDDLLFGSLDNTILEEERVNAISNNMVKFTFGHKDYLHFKLAGCDKIFQPRGKNSYNNVSKSLMEASNQYAEMTNLLHMMKEDATFQKSLSNSIIQKSQNDLTLCISPILNLIKKYHLAFYLQEARDYFNEQLKLAFGVKSYTIKVGVTENSQLYVSDNLYHKKANRALLRGDYKKAEKYLREGICSCRLNNNIKKLTIMKEQKVKTAGQVVVEQNERKWTSAIDNTAQVAKHLVALLRPESEFAQLLSIAKIDTATWLSNSTNGVVTYNTNNGFITLTNSANNVSVSVPMNNNDGSTEESIASALDFLMKTSQLVTSEGITSTSDSSKGQAAKSSCKTFDKKSEAKLRKKINTLFIEEKDNLCRLMLEKSNARIRKQTLCGQLYRIFCQCGYKGTRAKDTLVSMLNEFNQKAFNEMYNLAA